MMRNGLLSFIGEHARLGHKKESDRDIQEKMKLRIVILAIMMVAAMSIIIIVAYTNTLSEIRDIQEKNVQSHYDVKFDQLWRVLTEYLIPEANAVLTEVSEDIEQEIRAMDKDELKQDLDNGIYPDELINIFKTHLEGVHVGNVENGRNGTIVVSNDNILVNYLYYSYSDSDIGSASFSEHISSGWNQDLAEDALNKLFAHGGPIICTETIPPEKENHTKIEAVTKQTLQKVYTEEGIEGLKNYQILVPFYITDTGDVFGQDDIVLGQYNKETHKFIIILEINLYDQMDFGQLDHFDSRHIREMESRFCKLQKDLYITGIVFAVFILIIMLELVSVYNSLCMDDYVDVDKQNILSTEPKSE